MFWYTRDKTSWALLRLLSWPVRGWGWVLLFQSKFDRSGFEDSRSVVWEREWTLQHSWFLSVALILILSPRLSDKWPLVQRLVLNDSWRWLMESGGVCRASASAVITWARRRTRVWRLKGQSPNADSDGHYRLLTHSSRCLECLYISQICLSVLKTQSVRLVRPKITLC